MTESTTTEELSEERIRDTYEEFLVGGTRVGMIADPLNEHAWIHSTVTEAVRA